MPAAPFLAGGLAVASLVLASPVSALLAKASWTRRAPRAALVLWQSVCLSAGLCLIGAGFVIALEPLGHNIFDASAAWFGRLWSGRALVGMTGHGIITGTLSTAAALILFGVLIRSTVLTVRRRGAHRLLLDLLTGDRGPDPSGARPGPEIDDLLSDVRILDHASAVAYTLPGWHSRVVLSAGMVNLLARAELVAVIDHEKAHVRSRHDLLVLPFQAWGTAVGWLPGVRAAADSVAELTEMLADDWAASRSSPSTLAKALATVALAGVSRNAGVAGSQTPAVASRSVAARVERLRHPRPLSTWALTCVYVVALLLLAVPALSLTVGWS
ncbi:M56 family metallopeptidase [Nakamurella panacisegetis]|uniref:M56 family metallopeptidase n=1 Tax=Nakamurella panacisegetis TaxID=1090615 RepID=UPI001560C00C|nr:M56 family metallopeptidase [Nakamurella panacisegetis]